MTLTAALICAALIFLSAFFVMAEFAAVRVRETQLEALADGDPRARRAIGFVVRVLGQGFGRRQRAVAWQADAISRRRCQGGQVFRPIGSMRIVARGARQVPGRAT